jgi:hypothetical protein
MSAGFTFTKFEREGPLRLRRELPRLTADTVPAAGV